MSPLRTAGGRRPGRGSRSALIAGEPVRRHDSCAVCGGAITYYPRRSDDVVPRTSAVDEAVRWSHDTVSDWISRPHRARPAAGVRSGCTEGRARRGVRAGGQRGVR